MRHILYGILAGVLLSSGLVAQHPHFYHYSTQDGLPSNQVYDIFQDRLGYIWLCSDYGVSRFDGSHFENFGTADGLGDHEIFQGTEDRSGRIWWSSLNGRPSFWQDGQFYSAPQIPEFEAFKASGMIGNYFDDGERIWLCSSNGEIFFWDEVQQEAKAFYHNSKWIGLGFHAVWRSPDGQINAVSERSFYQFDSTDQSIQPIASWDSQSHLVKTFHAGDSLWATASDRLLLYHKAQKRILRTYQFDFINSEIIRVYQHPRLGLWLGTRQGVFHLPPGKDIERAEDFHHYLPQHAVSGIWIDQEENWWFSTLDAGIFVVRHPELREYTAPQSLPSPKVISLDGNERGGLWVGFNHNYYAQLIGDSMQISRIIGHQETGREVQCFVFPAPGEGPGSTLVLGKDLSHVIYEDGRVDLLYCMAQEMAIDDWGNYWLGVRRLRYVPRDTLQTWIFSPRDPLFEIYKERAFQRQNSLPTAHRINSVRINCLANTPGRMWVGTHEGLHYYDYESQRPGAVQVFAPLRGKISKLVYDAPRQRLWVGTDAQGVFLIRDGQLVAQWGLQEGLTSLTCTDLCVDEAGILWMASLNGINHIEWTEDGGQAHSFSLAEGLPSEKINAIEVVDSTLYVGTDFGLYTIDREWSKAPPVAPPVHLQAFEVGPHELLHAEQRRFSHADNSVRFAFAGFYHKKPDRLRFQYRLAGQHSEWVSTPAREVRFQSLAPGDYTFEVRAVNGEGLASVVPASLAFSIEPAPWQTNSFRLVVLALGILLLNQLWRWRVRRLRRKYELRNRLVRTQKEKIELAKHFSDLKISALQLQMNPHFIFNALNTIKGYYGAQKLREGGTFINKFAQLLRSILEYSNQYIPLNEEIRQLQLYLELSQTRYANRFDFKIHQPADLEAEEISLPSMLIQPFVENAILHGVVPKQETGQVDLYFELRENILDVRILDNGIGRAAAGARGKGPAHRSLATQITRERLAILHPKADDALLIEDLHDPETGACGTRVHLRIPVKNNWSND
ncbi:MAG: histidine kinase [Bacteroidota bacterium]